MKLLVPVSAEEQLRNLQSVEDDLNWHDDSDAVQSLRTALEERKKELCATS